MNTGIDARNGSLPYYKVFECSHVHEKGVDKNYEFFVRFYSNPQEKESAILFRTMV